ncbi:VirB4 family type IV secretion system protein [Haloarchaeobius salinus]|uniref:VirB4 family type IV secretion system protein n=1 Tax=Haloarchaeobius salinus TaxID=1198298 RepID=UPI002109D77B|nr:transfer complex protein [Haloarchaeobius salinus]
MIRILRSFFANDPEGDGEETDATAPNEGLDRNLGSVAESHRSLVSADSIEEFPNSVQMGEQLTRTQWVAEYPDAPTDGLFEQLYSTGETRETDIAIHVDPRDTDRTLNELENKIETLEADHEYLNERHRAGARGIRKDLEDYQDLYDVLRNTPMEAFDVSMYLTTRADEPDAERVDVDGVLGAARRAPANLTPVTPRWQQLDSLVSCSPIGVDRLDDSLDSTTPMLGGALGAMFPFVSGAFAEPGIEYGTYALNESPLILDRFERETGYCTMVIGKLGAGKSFSTKLQLLRRAMYDPDTIIVMLDPLEGFAGVSDALGGERVTVGGTRGFNPLEIRETPSEVLESTPDIDPWGEQVAWVLTFFKTFFTHVASNPLGDRTQTLRRAVQETYEQAGITRDPDTHGKESPTITDLMRVLESMLDEPEAFGYPTEGVQERVRADAEALLTDLQPSFRPDGDFANLAQPTEFDLDSSVVYLDLHQEEGVRGQAETSLMMQVLFNAVYERAKGTDKRVVFVIDEAHYLLHDSTSLGFLETAVRHSRHYDLSLHFITQTGGEFALTPEAKTIASLCSMTLIHRVDEEADKLAEWFGLSEREVNWVRTAKAGNDEDGFSEALLGIDEEGWFPLRVRASPYERQVLDGVVTSEREPGSDSKQHSNVRLSPDSGEVHR